jgi:hypothetical protein
MLENISDIEEGILQVIQFREKMIERAKRTLDFFHHGINGAITSELINLSKDFREYNIQIVERIIHWTLVNTPPHEECPRPFMYNGEEYLCKMLHDLDFISSELGPEHSKYGDYSLDDPFFVKRKGNTLHQKKASLSAYLIALDAESRRLESNPFSRKEDKNASDVVEDCEEKSSEDKVAELPHPTRSRRWGIDNVYNPNNRALVAKDSGDFGSQQPALVGTSFKGRKLYHRGKLIGEGAYAKV